MQYVIWISYNLYIENFISLFFFQSFNWLNILEYFLVNIYVLFFRFYHILGLWNFLIFFTNIFFLLYLSSLFIFQIEDYPIYTNVLCYIYIFFKFIFVFLAVYHKLWLRTISKKILEWTLGIWFYKMFKTHGNHLNSFITV